MTRPARSGRFLLLLVVVSVGVLFAGSGVVGGEGGAGGWGAAESAALTEWAAVDSTSLAQVDAPNKTTQGNPGNSGDSGPPPEDESESTTGSDQNNPGNSGDNGPPPKDESESTTGSDQNNPGNSGDNGPPPKDESESTTGSDQNGPGNSGDNGPPPKDESESTTGSDQNGPGNSGDSGPPADGDPEPPAHANEGSQAGAPEGSSNESTKDRRGPPAWVDPPSWEATNGTQGPPATPPGLANGSSRTVSVGGENVTVTVSRGPANDTPGERAWAQVRNAKPNASIPVALPEPARDGTIRTEALSIAVQKRQNVSLSVATGSGRQTNQTPQFTPSTAAEDMGYINVGHTVPDEEIENVTFRFSVSSSTLSSAERKNVALYRFHNGSWNELPTEYVDRNGSAYVFAAQSPGLSSFTVGKKVAAFQIQQATLLSDVQTTFDPVNVRVRVENEGGADGVFTAELRLDSETVDTDELTIAAGGTRQTSFEELVQEPGRYEVLVNNYTVGTVNVSETASQLSSGRDGETPMGVETARSEQSTPTEDGSGETGVRMPGFGVLVAILSLGIAIGSRRRRR